MTRPEAEAMAREYWQHKDGGGYLSLMAGDDARIEATASLLVRVAREAREEGKALIERLAAVVRETRTECVGKWVSGSGGHRNHERCLPEGWKTADWGHPNDGFAYCYEHVPEVDKKALIDMTALVADAEAFLVAKP